MYSHVRPRPPFDFPVSSLTAGPPLWNASAVDGLPKIRPLGQWLPDTPLAVHRNPFHGQRELSKTVIVPPQPSVCDSHALTGSEGGPANESQDFEHIGARHAGSGQTTVFREDPEWNVNTLFQVKSFKALSRHNSERTNLLLDHS